MLRPRPPSRIGSSAGGSAPSSCLPRAKASKVAALESLRGLGCRVHLDDYGTGDSSLQSVFQLPIDAIKIDRSFVRGLPGDPASAAIVDSTVLMAHRMGLRVIAEGVETPAQRDFLLTRHCRVMQGYLLSRPLPAAAITPSRESCSASHFTAVLGPTFSTPGTLSTVSPTSVR